MSQDDGLQAVTMIMIRNLFLLLLFLLLASVAATGQQIKNAIPYAAQPLP
jgi:hypothetical protein